MKSLRELLSTVEHLDGRHSELRERHATAKERLERAKKRAEVLAVVSGIIQKAAQLTQEQLEYGLGEIVTLAMETVGLQYKMRVRFDISRNRTEAALLFVDEADNEVAPMDAAGQGAVDVAAFALRVALWCMSNPRPRPVFILDEPFRNLSVDRQEYAAALLRELVDRFGFQFIIVTHEDKLCEGADRTFTVGKIQEGEWTASKVTVV